MVRESVAGRSKAGMGSAGWDGDRQVGKRQVELGHAGGKGRQAGQSGTGGRDGRKEAGTGQREAVPGVPCSVDRQMFIKIFKLRNADMHICHVGIMYVYIYV